MELTETQCKIYEGKICPYCLGPSDYIYSSRYYSNRQSYGMIYICWPCDALVGVHKGTDVALGRLANPELRKIKIQTHYWVDQIWGKKYMSRSDVYKYLSEKLSIPIKFTHINMFSIRTCLKAQQIAKEYLSEKEAEVQL